ncbi:MAG: VWA domain-containing protein [Planctomycetes bacterium]|nr:VWA domain-containing protein [Planctomycetota bacterium]
MSTFFESHFLDASALGWLAGLAPLIILLYFLKLKREEWTVPSTLLWQQSIEDLRVNAPFQRIRRNLLLFLQLLILLLAVLALARPLWNLKQEQSRRTIVLIDTSASMAAEDMEGTRLAAAQRAALELVSNMVAADQMAVIRFAAQSSVLSPFTSDRGRLREAIEGLQVEATETSLRDGLTIAFSLARAQPGEDRRAEVHLFSDGRFGDLGELGALSGEVTYHPMGRSGRNVGLVALDVGYSSGPESSSEIFYSLENFDAAETEVTVEFTFNDALIGVKKGKIGPGLRLSDLAPSTGNREGILKVQIIGNDAFPLDNTGWAVVRRPGRTRVFLVGEGDFFLTRALQVSGAEITPIAPADYRPAMAEEADIVLFDGWSPPQTGRGSFIFHNAHPVIPGLSVGENAESPLILDWDQTHPLMRFFSLAEVFVLEMPRITHPNWMRVLAQTTEGPLILCSEQENFRALYLPFHISRVSNFSAQGTFPIFVLNALRWLPTRGVHGPRQFRTGETLIAAAGTHSELMVVDPLGRRHNVAAANGRVLFPLTTQTGVYQVLGAGPQPEPYACNLLSAAESRIAPVEDFKLKGAEVKAEAGVARVNREIWHWLILAAFFILLFEWYVYNAKVYI